MADQWYYAQQGQRQGPVSEEKLKQLAALGQLKPSDKVWKKGLTAWRPASEVEGLFPKATHDEPPPLEPDPSDWIDFQERVKPPLERDPIASATQGLMAKVRLIAPAAQSLAAKLGLHLPPQDEVTKKVNPIALQLVSVRRWHLIYAGTILVTVIAGFINASTFFLTVPIVCVIALWLGFQCASLEVPKREGPFSDASKVTTKLFTDFCEGFWQHIVSTFAYLILAGLVVGLFALGATDKNIYSDVWVKDWSYMIISAQVAVALFGLIAVPTCLYVVISSRNMKVPTPHEAPWYRKAAEQGGPDAQFHLADCLQNGHGVPQDYAEAVQWYRKAAEQGHGLAECQLAACYRNGQGISQDNAEALNWYRKAADQGVAVAQFYLGSCYYDGDGVAQDYAEAVKWFRKAAEQGLADAQNSMGCCYDNGQGVPQDFPVAAQWYRKAAEQESPPAKQNLQRLMLQHPELDPLKKLGKGLLAGAAVVGGVAAAAAAAAVAAAAGAAASGKSGSGSSGGSGAGSDMFAGIAKGFYGHDAVCWQCGETGVPRGAVCRRCRAQN